MCLIFFCFTLQASGNKINIGQEELWGGDFIGGEKIKKFYNYDNDNA